MQRYTGHSLIAIGILHTVIGVLAFGAPLAHIARDGFFNAVDPHPDRQAAFWFLLTGALLVILGQSTCWTQSRTGTVPRSLGWGLLGISLLGVILMPASGFWLLLMPAWLALSVGRGDIADSSESGSVARASFPVRR